MDPAIPRTVFFLVYFPSITAQGRLTFYARSTLGTRAITRNFYRPFGGIAHGRAAALGPQA
jgi:hypothetical protein